MRIPRVTLLAVCAFACGGNPSLPEPPKAPTEAVLSKVDEAVIQGVLHRLRDFRRPFVVLNTTWYVCLERSRACGSLYFSDLFAQLHPSRRLAGLEKNFRERNARPFKIEALGGDDVTLVSPPLPSDDRVALLARYGGNMILQFTAPAYVGDDAVVFYRQFEAGGELLRLAGRGAGWEVIDVAEFSPE